MLLKAAKNSAQRRFDRSKGPPLARALLIIPSLFNAGAGMEYRIGNLAASRQRAEAPTIAPAVAAAPSASTGMVSGRRRRDLSLVLGLAGLAYLLAGRVELSEWFADWALGYEHWQADELPFTLIVLCAGLLWYGWRRDCETAAALHRNRELSRHLMQVQEAERRRLARELHDEFGQHCAAIRFEAQCLQRGLAQPEPTNPALSASAQAIAGSAEALQAGVRRLLRQLRPAALDTLGLDAALDELLRDWQLSHRIEIERHGCGAGRIGDAAAIAVFRVVQEALTNVARHARASRVSLLMTRCEGGLLVELADNGVGFGPAGAGFGIAGMQERAVDLGGELSFGAGVGGGALVRLRLPLKRGGAQ